MNAIVLSYEGFVGKSDKHLLKELCVYGVEDGVLYHNGFKISYCWKNQTSLQKQTNEWLLKNRHGLIWNSGCYRYSKQKGQRILQEYRDRPLYAKGVESQKHLSLFFPGFYIQNLEDVGCTTNIRTLCKNDTTACIYHNRLTADCAKQKAHALAEWIKIHLA